MRLKIHKDHRYETPRHENIEWLGSWIEGPHEWRKLNSIRSVLCFSYASQKPWGCKIWNLTTWDLLALWKCPKSSNKRIERANEWKKNIQKMKQTNYIFKINKNEAHWFRTSDHWDFPTITWHHEKALFQNEELSTILGHLIQFSNFDLRDLILC